MISVSIYKCDFVVGFHVKKKNIICSFTSLTYLCNKSFAVVFSQCFINNKDTETNSCNRRVLVNVSLSLRHIKVVDNLSSRMTHNEITYDQW